MHVVTTDTSPAAAALPGQLDHPARSATIVVKLTCDIVPGGRMTIAEEQLPIVGIVPHPDDELGTGAPLYDGDLAPFKPRADVVFTGTCRPLDGPTRACLVSLKVDDRAHGLLVVGDRARLMGVAGPTASEPLPFESMPLRYERAYGGPGYGPNPVGRGRVKTVSDSAEGESRPDETKRVLLPNLLVPGSDLNDTSGTAVCGFGPIGQHFEPRVRKVGSYDAAWLKTRSPWYPTDLDWGYFNAAPEALQVEGFLRGDETISYTNADTELAVVESTLPALRMRVFLSEEPENAAPPEDGPDQREDADRDRDAFENGGWREVQLDLDTLWVNGDERKAVLVWRGVAPARSVDLDEIRYLYTAEESIDAEPRDAGYYRELFVARIEVEKLAAAVEAGELPPEVQQAEAELPEIDPAAEAARERAIIDEQLRAKGATDDERASVSSFLDRDDTSELMGMMQKLRFQMERMGIDLNAPVRLSAEQMQLRNQMLRGMGLSQQEIELAVMGQADRDRAIESMKVSDAEAAAEAEAAGTVETLTWTRDRVKLFLSGQPAFETKLEGEPDYLPEPASLEQQDFSGLDLSGIDFTGATLTRVNLSHANLSGAVFAKAVLREADLSGATLADTVFAGCIADGARLNGATLDGLDLSGASFAEADLGAASMVACTLEQCVFDRATLAGADLSDAAAAGASFIAADLSNATLTGADVSGGSLHAATLEATDLRGANLAQSDLAKVTGPKVDLSKADLTGASMDRARLPNAVLVRAIAAEASWSKADLRDADLRGINATGAVFDGAYLAGADFFGATLRRAQFHGVVLTAARLAGADLFEVGLTDSNLNGADLTGANLYGSITSGSSFDGAVLDGAELTGTTLASDA